VSAQQSTQQMQGKICLVTGANSGIGYEAALALAQMGATVVMVCRNRAKGETAQAEIKTKSGNTAVDLMIADLSIQREVRRLADEFKAKYQKLHVLLNNAGGVHGQREVTADGYEVTFAVNHLAYYLLTELLLDVIKASAPARIINVASSAEGFGSLKFDDLMGEKRYGAMQAYGQSKRANIVYAYELAQRLAGTGVTVNAVHPGPVATNFGANSGGIMGLFTRIARPFELTPAQGASRLVYLATSPDVEGVTGKYYGDKKQIKSSAQTHDPAVQRQLREVSEQLTAASR